MICANASNGCDRPAVTMGWCQRCYIRQHQGRSMDLSVRKKRRASMPGMDGPEVHCPLCGRLVVESALYDYGEGFKPTCVRCAVVIYEMEEALT